MRRLTTAGVLPLIAMSALVACGDRPISPRPAQAAASSAPVTTGLGSAVAGSEPGVAPSTTRQSAKPTPVRSRSRTRSPGPGPTPTAPASTEPTSSCFGAVRHDLDLNSTELALVKSMCFHTGGVLRLQGIGPGLVKSEPESLVSQSYEGGVVDIRFVRAGTVTVTIPMEQQTYTITVVVVS